jgi:hypothetical protein
MQAPLRFGIWKARSRWSPARRCLGATQIRSLAENNNRWISFLDPEGNEFDLVAG